MNINELGARIDIKKAAELIGMAIGRDTPVSNKTVYEWMKRGHFPKKTPSALWSSRMGHRRMPIKTRIQIKN